jgi:hypothetical protein
MASRTERFKKTAIKAAKAARKWAETAAREADKLLAEAQKRAETEQRRMKVKAALRRGNMAGAIQNWEKALELQTEEPDRVKQKLQQARAPVSQR